jgi:AraC family transcriptional regulator
MTDKPAGAPRQPRIETCGAWLAAGLHRRYRYDDLSGLPGQWQELAPYLGEIPGRLGSAAYGVMLPVAGFDDGFDYLAGVEVSGTSDLPEAFEHARIPAARYAVFEHRGHVADIQQSWASVWNWWLDEAGCEAADEPVPFERYGADFDPATGRGVVGLWVPVR